MAEQREKILKIENLDISFKTTAGMVHAIRGVDIDLYKGETVAIVGESGSGKSVTMKAAMGILAKNATVNAGSIRFTYTHADGQTETVEILEKDKKWIRTHINGKRISMVFQDPMTSLDPTMNIGKQIMEGMIWHYKTKKEDAWKRAVELLREVGIEEPEKRMKNYPHQLSGGMRQRVVIAIALACDPDLLICDEPTTALDVTIQAKILELIKKIQEERGISVIYITHDLGVVTERSSRRVRSTRSTTIRAIRTPGVSSVRCRTSTPPTSVSIRSRVHRQTFSTRSRATPSHRVTGLRSRSTTRPIRRCLRSAIRTMQPPGFWTRVHRR